MIPFLDVAGSELQLPFTSFRSKHPTFSVIFLFLGPCSQVDAPAVTRNDELMSRSTWTSIQYE